MNAKQGAVYNTAKDLYLAMPGACPPPHDERGALWGEVEGTPEWLFCEAIARAIVNTHVTSQPPQRQVMDAPGYRAESGDWM